MLAALTERLAEAGVNIEALAAFGYAEDGHVRLIVDDASTAARVLTEAGLAAEEREVLTTTLPHLPGSLASLTRRLADSGVNIEALYLLKSHADGLEFAIAVDELETARAGLAGT
jgi:hypothetical protein